jgi:hypothetical protein
MNGLIIEAKWRTERGKQVVERFRLAAVDAVSQQYKPRENMTTHKWMDSRFGGLFGPLPLRASKC